MWRAKGLPRGYVELRGTALLGVGSRVLPWQAQTQPSFRAGLACLGLGTPPGLTAVTWAPRQHFHTPPAPEPNRVLEQLPPAVGAWWGGLAHPDELREGAHLLKRWAVWLSNKRGLLLL